MKKTLKDKLSDKLVNAFLNNKIISAIPKKFTKKLTEADKFRKLCESKIKEPVIGYKAGGTGIPLLKKLKEKEPFYASVYAINILKSGKRVKINKSTLGIELEVCYLIKKSFFSSKGSITSKNVTKFISHMAPCIEVVGYRQKRKGITSFGDLCSDFGGNVKFLIGQKKKYKRINIENLKANISNKKVKQSVNGNTNAVYINPLNSLRFVLNKVKKDKVDLGRDFYVFTGSTVGVVPILGKGLYIGKNVTKFISHMAPCIEVVGYRQKRKGITSFGDLSSDFGGNVKFLIGQKKKYKKINIGNLKANISNKKVKQSVSGNTNTVYINPLNSLRFVLNKVKKDKIDLGKDFYVFTGSTVGVVPILGKGLYTGKIDKLGSVKAIIS
jgi:2-keto-4-pentenoate hydratase